MSTTISKLSSISIQDYPTSLSSIPQTPISANFKFQHKFDPYNPILTITINNPPMPRPNLELLSIDDMPDLIYYHRNFFFTAYMKTQTNFTMMENVLVDSSSGFSKPGVNVFQYNHHMQKMPKKKQNFNYAGTFEYVIGLGHKYARVFGHFIFDYSPLVVALPSKSFEKAKFLIRSKPLVYKEYIEFIGINMSTQLLILKNNDYIFAKHFLKVDNIPWANPNFFLIKKLAKILRKKLDLKDTKPFRFVYFQRKRRVANKDMVGTLNRMYPSLNWELFQHTNQTLAEMAKVFNEALILMTVHGSNIANIIFMKPGTVLCTLSWEGMHHFFIVPAFALGLHHVMVRVPGLSSAKNPNYPFPLHLIKAHIDTALLILKKEKVSIPGYN